MALTDELQKMLTALDSTDYPEYSLTIRIKQEEKETFKQIIKEIFKQAENGKFELKALTTEGQSPS